MKKLLFILTACSPVMLSAQELLGPWKETARTDAAGAAVTYTDTLRIHFLIGNEYTWGRPMTYLLRGTYKIAGGVLDLGARLYTIRERGKERLVLSDKTGRYTLVPEVLPTGPDNSRASNGRRASGPDTYSGAPQAFTAMLGRWEVYKRTASAVQKSIDYSRQLHIIELKKNSEGEQGLVYASKDAQGKPSWYVDRYAEGTLYCKGRDARQLRVLHLADGELVVSEGEVTYFFKQFRQ